MSRENSQQDWLRRTELFVKEELGADKTGHDWWHIERVLRMTEYLVEREGGDLFLCRMAALLHDVADEKLNIDKQSGLDKVKQWLEHLQVPEEQSNPIMYIITYMPYNGGNNPSLRTLEGQIVQDADRLDAIGAIAIARTFLYAGVKGHPIHDPGLPPRDQMTPQQYRSEHTTAINHFYEKLLKLKNLINTQTGREIAEQRHQYMLQYLEQFHKEWNGAG
ncbi:HD domain-containing protein [Paenibacillus senegalensis]|uniref:HD domain-containing protein n=1 Tax=Paenibacillus senegalensis TaxID=1465766 RepID=UPI00028A3C4A|nr:HD domain-containing protein [Paenibacillus senegalensis]